MDTTKGIVKYSLLGKSYLVCLGRLVEDIVNSVATRVIHKSLDTSVAVGWSLIWFSIRSWRLSKDICIFYLMIHKWQNMTSYTASAPIESLKFIFLLNFFFLLPFILFGLTTKIETTSSNVIFYSNWKTDYWVMTIE